MGRGTTRHVIPVWLIVLITITCVGVLYSVVILSIFLGVGVTVKGQVTQFLSDDNLQAVAANAFPGDSIRTILVSALKDATVQQVIRDILFSILFAGMGQEGNGKRQTALTCNGVTDSALCSGLVATCSRLVTCGRTMNATICQEAGREANRLCNFVRV